MSSGTENPACSAIQPGLWPTIVGVEFRPGAGLPSALTPKINCSRAAFSSVVQRWACNRANSAMAGS